MVERETTLTPRNKNRIEEHTLQESTGAQNRSTFVSEGSSLCLRGSQRRQRLEPSLTRERGRAGIPKQKVLPVLRRPPPGYRSARFGRRSSPQPGLLFQALHPDRA